MISKKGYELKNIDTGKTVFISEMNIEKHVSVILLGILNSLDAGTDARTEQH